MESTHRYRLKQDLYVVNMDLLNPYTYITKTELDEAVTVAHAAGGIYTFGLASQTLSGPGGEFGIDGLPDPDLWEPYDPQLLKLVTDYDITGPNGEEILGTYENLSGTAALLCVHVEEDGAIEPRFEGGTDVHWNGQTTAYAAGERLYIDENANLWRESQLVFTPCEEQPRPAYQPQDEGGLCD